MDIKKITNTYLVFIRQIKQHIRKIYKKHRSVAPLGVEPRTSLLENDVFTKIRYTIGQCVEPNHKAPIYKKFYKRTGNKRVIYLRFFRLLIGMKFLFNSVVIVPSFANK